MRLQKIEPRHYAWLDPNDQCHYYGDYTAGGGFEASVTNRQIFNLKKKPTAKPGELYYKEKAVAYWGDALRKLLTLAGTQGTFTFVPMPGSKPVGHPEYDDRMLRVLQRMCLGVHGVDVRPLLRQTRDRAAQHEGAGRLSPTDLCRTLEVDRSLIPPPLASTIVVIDDVITMGASFAAAKQTLLAVPSVHEVVGVFLARTVWPTPDFDDCF